MTRFHVTSVCLLLVLTSLGLAQSDKAVDDSAQTWLALIDAGKYAASWDVAANYFKNAVSKDQWTSKARAVREPLGTVTSRKLASATPKTTLPGAPDGEYVILRYDSSFEHKQSAIETLTVMKEPDGQWRVTGYFIR
jgi:hypothetical protein